MKVNGQAVLDKNESDWASGLDINERIGLAVLDMNESDWTVLDINERDWSVLDINESDWASGSEYK